MVPRSLEWEQTRKVFVALIPRPLVVFMCWIGRDWASFCTYKDRTLGFTVLCRSCIFAIPDGWKKLVILESLFTRYFRTSIFGADCVSRADFISIQRAFLFCDTWCNAYLGMLVIKLITGLTMEYKWKIVKNKYWTESSCYFP